MADSEGVSQRSDGEEPVDPLLKAIGKQIKVLRDRAGLTQVQFGQRIGYGVDLVSAVECGRRPPKPPFIDGAERELDAGGLLDAVRDDIERAQYPARFREFVRLEAEALEIHSYSNHVVPGLLQTEDYAQALYRMRRPAFDDEVIEQHVAARMVRHSIFERRPAPVMSFVVEEAVLRRPLGGRAVLQGQQEHLLRSCRNRNVELQVMPIDVEEHAGLVGSLTLLELKDKPKVAYTESQERSTWFTERTDVRAIEARYGTIRAQALTPRESLEFIEKLLGDA
ncbi:MAG: helix-turn-helix domain-containing protein [Streptomyces sp.]|uniref:helix-turn-helix domain-containing protein n=1 Tax=Streptomyces sp. TaxID=1931 RepID=UPI003D6A3F9A